MSTNNYPSSALRQVSVEEIIGEVCKNPECGHTRINHRRFFGNTSVIKKTCVTFDESKRDYCNCDDFKIS